MRLSEIRSADVDRVQHVALMRLTLKVMGETHRILGDLQAWLAGEVRRRAGDDGAVGVTELAGLSNQVESRWRQAMKEWRALFDAALVQAGSLPFGALVVRHNHFMGLVQPVRESDRADGANRTDRAILEEDFSPDEVGALIGLWQERRARALQAASERTMPDRLTLSQRVWRLDNGGLQQIQGTLAGAYAERTNAYDLAARLESQLGANQDLPRWTSTRLYRMTPTDRMNDERGLLRGEENRGRGIAYNALRLARTEIQYANVYNHIEIARHTPWTTGKKVRLSPQHPQIDVCDGLAEGGPYAVQDVIIPAHPNCLCYEEYVLMEDRQFAQQVRGWLEGSNTFLDDYQGWLGSIQPTELMPWNMTIADSLELWMSMSGDGHAAALRLGGGRTGGEEPGPRPVTPVIPRQPIQPQSVVPAQTPTQPQAPGPVGTPVSQALNTPSSGKYARVYEDALTAIDAVHGDGTLPEIPVKTQSNMQAHGQYVHFIGGGPRDIAINGKGDHLQTTLAHEVGHFLDHMGIGEPGKFASESSPLLGEWRQATGMSQAMQSLVNKSLKPESYAVNVTVTHSSGQQLTYNAKPSPEHLRYLLSDKEVWARSYAQYVATRSGNEAMLAQIAEQRKDQLYGDRQWADDDFQPIARAIDNLFQGLGWRK